MRHIPYTLLVLAATAGFASAQATAYTTPVGYVTTELTPDQYTLAGLTLHPTVIASGVIDVEAVDGVTDSEIDFTTLLAAGSTYMLELEDGTIQEVTSWTGSKLDTPEDITGVVVPATTKYKLRKAPTVAEIFGAANSVGFVASPDGDYTTVDQVLVPSGGAFVTIYYYDDGAGTTGWYTDQGAPADDYVLTYPESFYVKRIAGSTLELVVSGEVKTTPVSGALVPEYNYLSSVAPVGLTLATSGLENFLTQSPDGDYLSVDNVILQQGASFITCYYYNDGAGTTGWYDDQGGSVDGSALQGGFLIYNRGTAKPYTVSVPAGYSSL